MKGMTSSSDQNLQEKRQQNDKKFQIYPMILQTKTK